MCYNINMIISFFGHKDFSTRKEYKEKIFLLLEELAKNNKVEAFIGGYGNFDSFILSCCTELKKSYKNLKIIFITPYIGKYLENRKSFLQKFDQIIYPPIENCHPRFAILRRNEWIINQSDKIIFYIDRNFGGAYTAMQYSLKKNKKIINIYP